MSNGSGNLIMYVVLCAYVAAGASAEMREIGQEITALFQQVINTLQSQPWHVLS